MTGKKRRRPAALQPRSDNPSLRHQGEKDVSPKHLEAAATEGLRELPTDYVPKQLKTEVMEEALEVVRDIEDQEYRVEVLVKLAPCLPEKRLHQALQEVQLLWDESYRAGALSDLIQYIPEEQLSEFQQAVRAMRSEKYRTEVLIQLLPRLPEALLEQALDIVQATWDEGCRVEILAKLAPYAPEALLPKLLEMVGTIEDRGYRVWLLAELEAPLTGKLKGTHFDMLSTFQAIKEKEERLHTLLAIVPRLSEEALSKIFGLMLPEVFGFMWLIQREERRAHMLAKLGGRLPEAWLQRASEGQFFQLWEAVQAIPSEGRRVRVMRTLALHVPTLSVLVPRLPEERLLALLPAVLKVVRVMRPEEERVWAFTRLASNVPEGLLKEMLETLWSTVMEQDRAGVLSTLLPSLSEAGWAKVLELAIVKLRDSGEVNFLLQVL